VKEELIMATGKRERNEIVERELEQALRTMHDAHRRNDLVYLDEAMADDFTIIHANGDLLTKKEWFADLRSGATSWELLDVHDVESRVFGDLAVVHNRQDVRGRLRSTPFEARTRSTNILVREGGRWRFLNIHFTRDR
jgi:ketosteroid isomerase-like protein